MPTIKVKLPYTRKGKSLAKKIRKLAKQGMKRRSKRRRMKRRRRY